MKLTEIFLALEAGELSTQTSLVDTVTGVKPENYSKVISHINLGLVKIYERFNIKLGDSYIMMLDGVAEYFLDSKYALSNTKSNEVKYIIDSPHQPFRNNAIKIVEAFTEIGEPLPINDRTEEKSIFTPSQLSIQIPWKNEGDVINVVYRAMPDEIRLDDYDGDVTLIDVELPRTYMEALLYWVAHRHFAGVGGQSATPTSQAYYQKFLQRLDEIQLNGVPNMDNSASTTFQRDGWV